LTVICLLAVTPVPAADFDQELERSYNRWRSAMVNKNIRKWSAATSPYRYATTRNLIISQKLAWPRALFEIPVVPPEVTQLTVLEARAVGDTAHLAYIGPVDFGVVDGDLPENVLVLHFHKAKDAWRYDRSQFVNLAANPEIRDMAKRKDTSFLRDRLYSPPGTVPKPPPPCAKPDYVGQLRIQSVGYHTRIKINGTTHQSEVLNTSSSDLIIGGLKSGRNPFEVSITPLPASDENKRKFTMSVFATSDLQNRAPSQVFFYEPKEVPKTLTNSIWVNASKLNNK